MNDDVVRELKVKPAGGFSWPNFVRPRAVQEICGQFSNVDVAIRNRRSQAAGRLVLSLLALALACISTYDSSYTLCRGSSLP